MNQILTRFVSHATFLTLANYLGKRGGTPWPPLRSKLLPSTWDPDVLLSTGIYFEVIGKLSTEARHFDRLPLVNATHIYSRRSSDEHVDIARAIVDDRLRDRSRDVNDRSFGPFTYASGCNVQRLHLWTGAVSFGICDVDEYQ